MQLVVFQLMVLSKNAVNVEKNRLSDCLQFGNRPVPKSPVAGHVLMTWVLGGICFLRGLG